MSTEFKEFPKMPRLSRDIIITEKIDGTNASVYIAPLTEEDEDDPTILLEAGNETGVLTIRAGSGTQWLTTGNDNFGFAKWVYNNALELLKLGEGHHFGEWWGQGIQRNYGLKEKRFSLFNTYRWSDGGTDVRPSCCHIVPILYTGAFNTDNIDFYLKELETKGSHAAPGFMKPEGVVVWHTAGNIGFKKTILKDEVPKSLVKE